MTGLPGRDWHMAWAIMPGRTIRHQGQTLHVSGVTEVGRYRIIDTVEGTHLTVHHLSSVEVLTP